MSTETINSTGAQVPPNTLTPEATADIFSFYGLGAPGEIQPVGEGMMHTSYFVESASGDQVVRVLGYEDAGVLDNEAHIQAQLAAAGVSTPIMARSGDGQFVYREEGLAATVSPRMSGTHPRKPSVTDCFAVGLALGQFHQAVKDLPNRPPRTLLGEARVDADIARQTDSERSEQLRALQEISSAACAPDLPSGVRHGDFHSRNVLIHEEVATVLDLETAAPGSLLLDICRSMADICRVKGSGYMQADKAAHFIKGYEQVRTLTPEERSLLPRAVVYGYLAVASFLLAHGATEIGDTFVRFGVEASQQI